MSRIRSANTRPELLVRRELWQRGLRYRLHQSICGSRPDIIFARTKVVVFIDGCFWHGCPQHYAAPKSRVEFWAKKLSDNVLRDARQTQMLRKAGWCILRYMTHEIFDNMNSVINEIEFCARYRDCSSHANHWRVFSSGAMSTGQTHQQLICLETNEKMERVFTRLTSKMSRNILDNAYSNDGS